MYASVVIFLHSGKGLVLSTCFGLTTGKAKIATRYGGDGSRGLRTKWTPKTGHAEPYSYTIFLLGADTTYIVSQFVRFWPLECIFLLVRGYMECGARVPNLVIFVGTETMNILAFLILIESINEERYAKIAML